MTNLTLLLFLADASANLLAFFTAYTLRNYSFFRLILDAVQPLNVYIKVLPMSVALYVVILWASSLYSRKKRLTFGGEIRGLFLANAQWWIILMALSYLAKIDYSRLIVLMYFLLSVVLNTLTRYLVRDLQLRLVKSQQIRRNVLIVGTGKVGREVARRLYRYTPLGYRVVGFVPGLGTFSELPAIIVEHSIREVYLADPNLSPEVILDMIASVEKLKVRFLVVTSIFDLAQGRLDRYDIETIPSLEIGSSPSLIYTSVKRSLDLVAASLLFILLSPLFILLTVLIKLTSPGPALFRQIRVGFREFPFAMYKFRTMYIDELPFADSPSVIDDPRVTRVGRFLRRTSLDELPQLINVIRGEMSLVGPRPEMPFKVKNYTLWQRKRFSVRPGMTGLWQIIGRMDLPLSENLEYDFYYINNQSLLLDLEILVRTLPAVLMGKGAY